jgi:phosphatidylethanolamine-binding protein (PEBP) family uncharacterized protein
VVIGADFQRQLAASPATGLAFDSIQQCPPDAYPPKVWTHCQVVDIQQGSGSKRGETTKADCQTDRFTADASQKDQRAWMGPESWDQQRAGLLGQRGVLTHWIARVHVQ